MENKDTIFTITNYDKTITIRRPYSDVTISDLIEDFVALMVGITFSKDQVISGLQAYVDDEMDENI